MATSGTITEVQSTVGTLLVTITGMTEDTESLPFTLKGYPYSSATVDGTFGGTTAQWQGSNDTITWVDIGSTFAAGPAGGTLTPDGVPFMFYKLVLTGGTGVDLDAVVSASRANN